MVLSDDELINLLDERYDIYDIVEELELTLLDIVHSLLDEPARNEQLRKLIERT